SRVPCAVRGPVTCGSTLFRRSEICRNFADRFRDDGGPHRSVAGHSPVKENLMHRRLFLALIALPTFACAHSNTPASSVATPARGKEPLVEFEMMTWPEVKAA